MNEGIKAQLRNPHPGVHAAIPARPRPIQSLQSMAAWRPRPISPRRSTWAIRLGLFDL